MNQKLVNFFKQEGLENCIQEFEQPSATSEQAANEIGCTIEQIAKSITFKIEERTILIVAAGNAKIDNQKYKEKFCKKSNHAFKRGSRRKNFLSSRRRLPILITSKRRSLF